MKAMSRSRLAPRTRPAAWSTVGVHSYRLAVCPAIRAVVEAIGWPYRATSSGGTPPGITAESPSVPAARIAVGDASISRGLVSSSRDERVGAR